MSPIIVAVWSQNDPKEPHMRPLYGCLAAALTLSLAACTPTPATTPTPVPTTYQCTPEAGGEPYTCTEAQHQDMLKKDALYAEAEQVYRSFTAENIRLFRSGAPASPELLSLVSGEAKKSVLAEHAQNAQLAGGEVVIDRVERLVGVSRSGSIVALESCTDQSSMRVVIGGKDSGPGRTAKERSYYSREGGRLVMVEHEHLQVESC